MPKIENTIAIKAAITDTTLSGSDNANPRIRNNDYVSVLLTLLLAFKQSLRVRIRALKIDLRHSPTQRAYPRLDIEVAVSLQLEFSE